MKNILKVGTLALSLFLVACDKEDDDTENVTAQDQSFMTQAAISNRSEIELGNLAVSMASDSAVRQFAQTMITEHTVAQDLLEDIADNLDFGFPNLDTAGSAMKQMLSAYSGRQFDSVYIHTQVAAHQATVSVLQTQMSNGSNQQLRTYAAGLLPTVQMHQAKADSLSNTY